MSEHATPSDFPPGYLERFTARVSAAPGATSTPLPGPVRGVFAPEPVKAGAHTLRRMRMGDWVTLTALENPLANVFSGEAPQFSARDLLIAGLVFTLPYPEAAALAVAPKAERVHLAHLRALEQFADEDMLDFLPALGAAILQNLGMSRATALQMDREQKGEGSINFPPTPEPTASAGGQASIAPSAKNTL